MEEIMQGGSSITSRNRQRTKMYCSSLTGIADGKEVKTARGVEQGGFFTYGRNVTGLKVEKKKRKKLKK